MPRLSSESAEVGVVSYLKRVSTQMGECFISYTLIKRTIYEF